MELGGQGWGKLLYINWEMVPRMRIGTWVFIGRIDGEADTPIFWPPDAKS